MACIVSKHGERKLAVGTDTGIYFKAFNRHGITKVLSSENVTQLAVLDRYNILLVLAGNCIFFLALQYTQLYLI